MKIDRIVSDDIVAH